jgi:AcrR family transcriptional regulator
MPRSPAKTLAAIHQAGFDLFHKRGYSRVSMEDIAAAAGVTKRTLYYHYDSKDTLVGAVLNQQLAHSLRTIHRWGEPPQASIQEFLDSIFDQLVRWASSPKWTGSGFTRLTVELADLPGHPARKAASRHKSDIESWIRKELERLKSANPDAQARRLCLLIEGATVLALIHDDTAYLTCAHETALELIGERTLHTR